MANLRLRPQTRGRTPEAVNCVETRTKAKEVKRPKIDPRTNDDNQVTQVEETTIF